MDSGWMVEKSVNFFFFKLTGPYAPAIGLDVMKNYVILCQNKARITVSCPLGSVEWGDTM